MQKLGVGGGGGVVVHEFIEKLVYGFHGTKNVKPLKQINSVNVCMYRMLQKCLFPLLGTVVNIQMYRGNCTAFANKTTSRKTCQMINSFVKLDSCNKFKSPFVPECCVKI